MLWFSLSTLKVKSFRHNSLVKGHTFNEEDSFHSTVESASKIIDIFTPAQWSAVIRTVSHKRRCNVKDMGWRIFFDFKEIARHLVNFEIDSKGNRIVWQSIRELYMEVDRPNTLFM